MPISYSRISRLSLSSSCIALFTIRYAVNHSHSLHDIVGITQSFTIAPLIPDRVYIFRICSISTSFLISSANPSLIILVQEILRIAFSTFISSPAVYPGMSLSSFIFMLFLHPYIRVIWHEERPCDEPAVCLFTDCVPRILAVERLIFFSPDDLYHHEC